MKALTRLMFIPLLCFSVTGWIWGETFASKAREGNKLYKEGKIDEALSKWREAQVENPDKEELHYNIGNGLHGQKKYEDSFKEYEKNLNSKNAELKAKTYYNIGNTQYRMGKLEDSISSYEECLKINPEDEDAKYNIEFIKKKLEEKKQQSLEQKEDKNKDQQDKQQAEQEKNKEEKGREEEQQKEDKAEEEKKEDGKEVSGNPSSSLGAGRPQVTGKEENKQEMSKEDASRLLDAMKDDEKDLQKELRKKPIEARYRVDKDW